MPLNKLLNATPTRENTDLNIAICAGGVHADVCNQWPTHSGRSLNGSLIDADHLPLPATSWVSRVR